MDTENLTTSNPNGPSNERQVLFDFWKILPPLISIDASSEEIYGKTNFFLRRAIVRILRTGIIEEFKGQKRRRHALTAQEILDLLPRHLEDDPEIKIPSLTNLYFHLEKLEHGKVKLIQPVAILREKRKKRRFPITYYGRTARIILYTGSKDQFEKKAKQFSSLAQLMQVLQPEIQVDQLNGLLEKVIVFQKARAVQISEWIEKHDDYCLEAEICVGDVLECLNMLDPIHPEYQQILKEITELLQLDLSKI
ncbi:MAG: hypothetical protein ACE5OZ_17415 [Candidatus Heimdallarchaeota archaeon]